MAWAIRDRPPAGGPGRGLQGSRKAELFGKRRSDEANELCRAPQRKSKRYEVRDDAPQDCFLTPRPSIPSS